MKPLKILNIRLYNFIIFLILVFTYSCLTMANNKIPFHHLPDGSFRNPEGSPKRDENIKWSYKIFNKEKKKLDMTVLGEHIVEKEKVLSDLEKFKNEDYIAWIGHATFII